MVHYNKTSLLYLSRSKEHANGLGLIGAWIDIIKRTLSNLWHYRFYSQFAPKSPITWSAKRDALLLQPFASAKTHIIPLREREISHPSIDPTGILGEQSSGMVSVLSSPGTVQSIKINFFNWAIKLISRNLYTKLHQTNQANYRIRALGKRQQRNLRNPPWSTREQSTRCWPFYLLRKFQVQARVLNRSYDASNTRLRTMANSDSFCNTKWKYFQTISVATP